MNKTCLQRWGFLVLAMLLLQACFVSRNYERPESSSTDGLFRMDSLPGDTTSMASLSWEQFFEDPILKAYIGEGLENNLDVRIALQRLLAAQAYMKQGKAGYLPSLQSRATLTHQELAANSQFGAFFDGSLQQYELSASFAWEADIWGKLRSNRRATLAAYLQQKATHQAVTAQLVAQIANAYYQLLALDSQHAVTSATIRNRMASLETMKALKEAGNVTQVAVDQTAAQLYNSQALLVDLEAQIFQTENVLAYLMGRSPGFIGRGQLREQPLPERLQVGVPARLLSNRPDVRASEFQLINAFELTNVARSNFYPSFTLTGTGGLQSLEFEKWFDSGSLFANLVAGIAQPIFNRRQLRTQLEAAQAMQEEQLLNFRKTLLIAGQEVSDALYAYKAESLKYGFRQQEVEALRRAEIHSEALLKNGFGTYLDLLTARQNALNAELNVIDNKLRQLQALVSLYRALGGGWQ